MPGISWSLWGRHLCSSCFFSSPRVHSAQKGFKKHRGVSACLNPGLNPKSTAVHLQVGPQSRRQRQHLARTRAAGCNLKVEIVKLVFLSGCLSLFPEAPGPGIPFPSLASISSSAKTVQCPQATAPPAGHTGVPAEAQHGLETLAELKGGNRGSRVFHRPGFSFRLAHSLAV